MNMPRTGFSLTFAGASSADMRELITKCQELGGVMVSRGVPGGSHLKIDESYNFCRSDSVEMCEILTTDQALGRETDNGWHERKELPPVGTKCEVYRQDSWVKCEIKAHMTKAGKVTAFFQMDNKWGFDSRPEVFRPIKTERQEFVERFAKEWESKDKFLYDFIGDQFDKGLRYTK